MMVDMDMRHIDQLRARPDEWRRRGLTPPDELRALVESRVHAMPRTTVSPAEPSYADFFGTPVI